VEDIQATNLGRNNIAEIATTTDHLYGEVQWLQSCKKCDLDVFVTELIQVMGSVDDAFFAFCIKSRTKMLSSSQLKNTSNLKNNAEAFSILRKLHLVFQIVYCGIVCTIHKVDDLNFHMPY
jgi:hypothetical protein